MTEKMWKDCSTKEKRQYYKIKRLHNNNLKDFKEGKIDGKTFQDKTTKLIEKLDELEKEYEDK